MRILGLFAAVTQGLQEAIDLPCPEDWCVLGFVFPKHFDPVIFSGERIEEHLCYEVINTFNFEHSVYKEALSLCLMVWFVPLELKLTVRELLLQSDLCRSVQNQRQCRSCSAGVWLCGMGAAGKVWNPPRSRLRAVGIQRRAPACLGCRRPCGASGCAPRAQPFPVGQYGAAERPQDSSGWPPGPPGRGSRQEAARALGLRWCRRWRRVAGLPYLVLELLDGLVVGAVVL